MPQGKRKTGAKKPSSHNNAAIARAVRAERSRNGDLRKAVSTVALDALDALITDIALNGNEAQRSLARLVYPMSIALRAS